MEIDTPLLAVLGAAVVLATFADLVWTAVAVGERRGPVSDAVARGVTTIGTSGAAGHRRRRVTGVVTAVAIPAAWLLLLWAGFALMFLSDDDAVLVSTSQQPVGGLGRLAYAAGALAGAGAGLIAGTETWQLVNNVAALSGLALVTLSLTYLMQVISAVVDERSVMSQVAALTVGGDRVTTTNGGTWPLQLVMIAQAISTAAHRHLAFPMLQYFHSSSATASAPVNLARYDLLLDDHERRSPDDEATVRTGRSAVEEFLGTLRLEVDAPTPDRRERLRAFVTQEGWSWDDVTDA